MSDKVTSVVLAFCRRYDEGHLLVCCIKWQELFYSELRKELIMYSVDELALCLSDIGLHVGRHIMLTHDLM